jgi:polysaccharide deacetylase 2 family uncharacterized protein YibQ
VDDLNAPLRKTRKRKDFGNLFAMLPIAVTGLLGLCLFVFVVWAAVVRDPLGGEPVVVVSVDRPAPKPGDESPAGKTADAPDADAGSPSGTPPAGGAGSGMQTITIIDGSSGQRQEVAIPSSVRVATIDQRLLEQTRHGLIPRVGLDGGRASVLYARPAGALPGNLAAVKVAVVMTGLGVGASVTNDAISKLPAPVTLAFVPYGAELERLVARARNDGHEILLHVPMEPIDFPESDPGPHTLLTTLTPEQNIDRMHWVMSRAQGYVGLVNQMGARFTATEQALAPMLRETAKRGLVYLDDGSSPRSLATQIAGANNLPFAKANIAIDAVPSQAEIDRALVKLEETARENGVAVGVASASPLAIDRLAKWAKSAPGRGILLVPITAVAAKAKSS